MSERNVCIAGGAGFIGRHFTKLWLDAYQKDRVIILDDLSLAGSQQFDSMVRDIVYARQYSERVRFVQCDIADTSAVRSAFETYPPNIIVNFAAESHNSYAYKAPARFYHSNVCGPLTMLSHVLPYKNTFQRFHHVSTCEVFGDMSLKAKKPFTEKSPYKAQTTYSLSKATAEMEIKRYCGDNKLPFTISNCANNFGPFQFPEKVIPLFATNILRGKKIPLYKEWMYKREWIHVLDHCLGILCVMRKGISGETYNIGTGVELSVRDIAECVLSSLLGSSYNFNEHVEIVGSRPQHDRRYVLDSSKIRRTLSWAPVIDAEHIQNAICRTAKWYKDSQSWWELLLAHIRVDETNWQAGKQP